MQLLALAVLLAAIEVVGMQQVPVPSLVHGVLLPVPVVAFLPLIPVAALLIGVGGHAAVVEATAVRRVAAYDAAAIGIVMGLVCAGCVLLGGLDVGVAAGRNLVGYVGLSLVAFKVIGPLRASLVAPAFVVTASILGRSPGGTPAVWAWPLSEGSRVSSTLLAAGLFFLGLTALLLGGRQPGLRG